ncbi:MAG: lipoprotein [Pseudomonadota bacterium]
MKKLVALLLLVALTACGQTGDLYLPPAAQTPTPETPADAEENEEDDEETPAG